MNCKFYLDRIEWLTKLQHDERLNAHSPALAEHNEVILYFGTGRGPIGTSDGMLFALKEGCIVPLGKKFLAPTGRFPLEIKDGGNPVG